MRDNFVTRQNLLNVCFKQETCLPQSYFPRFAEGSRLCPVGASAALQLSRAYSWCATR